MFKTKEEFEQWADEQFKKYGIKQPADPDVSTVTFEDEDKINVVSNNYVMNKYKKMGYI